MTTFYFNIKRKCSVMLLMLNKSSKKFYPKHCCCCLTYKWGIEWMQTSDSGVTLLTFLRPPILVEDPPVVRCFGSTLSILAVVPSVSCVMMTATTKKNSSNFLTTHHRFSFFLHGDMWSMVNLWCHCVSVPTCVPNTGAQ